VEMNVGDVCGVESGSGCVAVAAVDWLCCGDHFKWSDGWVYSSIERVMVVFLSFECGVFF
jgi:hypothetical protein